MRALLIVLLLTATATARPGGAQAPFVPPTRSTGAGGGGDITGVTAGTGLTGGATSGNATLAADTTYLQRLVSGVCAPGSSIRVINSDGTVACEPDDVGTGTVTNVSTLAPLQGGPITTTGTISLINCPANDIYKENAGGTAFACAVDNDTTYTAGAGLSLGGTTFSLAAIAATTILGNNTVGAAVPTALTGTQVTAMLDTFTSTLKGLAPASGGGTANFLRADGTWATPPGTGVTGTGTANTLPIWTSTTALGNSPIAYDGSTTLSTAKAWLGGLIEATTPDTSEPAFRSLRHATAPGVPGTDLQWGFGYDSGSTKFRWDYFNGTVWSGPWLTLDPSGNVGMFGALDLGTHQIHNVTDPSSAQDAATKNYADTHIGASGTLTSGKMPVATGAAALGDSIASATTSGITIDNTTATNVSQLQIQRGGVGNLSLNNLASGNEYVVYGAHYNGTSFIADDTTGLSIGKFGGGPDLLIGTNASQTPGSSTSFTNRAILNLSTGLWDFTSAVQLDTTLSVASSASLCTGCVNSSSISSTNLTLNPGANAGTTSIAAGASMTGGITIGASGNATTVGGALTATGALAASSTAHVIGATTLDSTLGVVGNVTIGTGSANSHVTIPSGSNNPVLSSCGTSPTIVGGDTSGRVVTGTGAGACTITFKTAFSSNVDCIVINQTGALVASYSVSATAITVSSVAAGATLHYICTDH